MSVVIYVLTTGITIYVFPLLNVKCSYVFFCLYIIVHRLNQSKTTQKRNANLLMKQIIENISAKCWLSTVQCSTNDHWCRDFCAVKTVHHATVNEWNALSHALNNLGIYIYIYQNTHILLLNRLFCFRELPEVMPAAYQGMYYNEYNFYHASACYACRLQNVSTKSVHPSVYPMPALCLNICRYHQTF